LSLSLVSSLAVLPTDRRSIARIARQGKKNRVTKRKKPAEAGWVGNALLRLSNRCVKGYSDGERMQVALCQVGGRETRRESVPYTQVFRERGKKVFVLLQHPLDESAAFCRIVQVVAQWKRAVFDYLGDANVCDVLCGHCSSSSSGTSASSALKFINLAFQFCEFLLKMLFLH
jgi:hypothetical protein